MKKEAISRVIRNIIEKYNQSEEFLRSTAYGDGGLDNPFPRLDRAAMNQVDGEDGATLSRYAIWANTVRDNIIEAAKLSKNGDHDKSMKLLQRSVNSLSAFSEIQAYFDPFKGGRKNAEPTRVRI